MPARFLLAAVVLLLLAPRAGFAQAPAFLLQWGTQGTGPGQFPSAPGGVAVDAQGIVYVIDDYSHRIQKFNGDGVYVGQLNFPVQSSLLDLTIDAAGNLYVADVYDRISKYTTAGVFVRQWGTFGGAPGYFNDPSGVATDAAGNVYVTEFGNCRVQKFTADGVYLTEWGYLGSADGAFRYPTDVVVDAADHVYVTDSGNNRIQEFTNTGEFITSWGTEGSGDGQFKGPWRIAVDPAGDLYVTDQVNYRVQKFTSSGTYLCQWGSFGYGPGLFAFADGIAIDSQGSIYVSDYGYFEVQKFGYVPTPATPFSWGRLKAAYRK